MIRLMFLGGFITVAGFVFLVAEERQHQERSAQRYAANEKRLAKAKPQAAIRLREFGHESKVPENLIQADAVVQGLTETEYRRVLMDVANDQWQKEQLATEAVRQKEIEAQRLIDAGPNPSRSNGRTELIIDYLQTIVSNRASVQAIEWVNNTYNSELKAWVVRLKWSALDPLRQRIAKDQMFLIRHGRVFEVHDTARIQNAVSGQIYK